MQGACLALIAVYLTDEETIAGFQIKYHARAPFIQVMSLASKKNRALVSSKRKNS